MKLPITIFVSAILLMGITEGAMAACSDTQVEDAALTTLLSGNTVCVSNGSGGWENQEEHMPLSGGVGELWDYKEGPGDAVDPRIQVGSWSISGSAANTVVTYSYDDGKGNTSGPFSFTVHHIGGTSYSFCGVSGTSSEVVGTVKTGTGAACP